MARKVKQMPDDVQAQTQAQPDPESESESETQDQVVAEYGKKEHTIKGEIIKLGCPRKLGPVMDLIVLEDAFPVTYWAGMVSLAMEAGGSTHPPASWAKARSARDYGNEALENMLKVRKWSVQDIIDLGLHAKVILSAAFVDLEMVEERAKN